MYFHGVQIFIIFTDDSGFTNFPPTKINYNTYTVRDFLSPYYTQVLLTGTIKFFCAMLSMEFGT